MKIEQLSEIEANIYQVLKEYIREFNIVICQNIKFIIDSFKLKFNEKIL